MYRKTFEIHLKSPNPKPPLFPPPRGQSISAVDPSEDLAIKGSGFGFATWKNPKKRVDSRGFSLGPFLALAGGFQGLIFWLPKSSRRLCKPWRLEGFFGVNVFMMAPSCLVMSSLPLYSLGIHPPHKKKEKTTRKKRTEPKEK